MHIDEHSLYGWWYYYLPVVDGFGNYCEENQMAFLEAVHAEIYINNSLLKIETMYIVETP